MPFNVGRLLPDGTLDANFSLSLSDPGSILNQGFLATDFSRTAGGSFVVRGFTADSIFTGARFLPSGMEDPSFAWDSATPTYAGSTATADGKLLLFAETDDQSAIENTLTRLRQSGEIDPDFQLPASIRAEQIERDPQDNLPIQLATGSRVLAVQPDGKIIFIYLALSDGNFHLVRLQPDGALDGSFVPNTRRPQT